MERSSHSSEYYSDELAVDTSGTITDEAEGTAALWDGEIEQATARGSPGFIIAIRSSHPNLERTQLFMSCLAIPDNHMLDGRRHWQLHRQPWVVGAALLRVTKIDQIVVDAIASDVSRIGGAHDRTYPRHLREVGYWWQRRGWRRRRRALRWQRRWRHRRKGNRRFGNGQGGCRHAELGCERTLNCACAQR